MKEKIRCGWCLKFDQYIQYHDEEWGVPVHDDIKHFEFLILEGAQAGLSWATILKKREGYRKNFADFDPTKVARFTEARIQKILLDPTIIRNKLKVYAAVNNAKRFLEVQKEFGTFNQYIWSFVGGKPIDNKRKSLSEVPATTKESDALSKDLIGRGFKFVGSTVIYAHMQACGLVNDHLIDCWRYKSSDYNQISKGCVYTIMRKFFLVLIILTASCGDDDTNNRLQNALIMKSGEKLMHVPYTSIMSAVAITLPTTMTALQKQQVL